MLNSIKRVVSVVAAVTVAMGMGIVLPIQASSMTLQAEADASVQSWREEKFRNYGASSAIKLQGHTDVNTLNNFNSTDTNNTTDYKVGYVRFDLLDSQLDTSRGIKTAQLRLKAGEDTTQNNNQYRVYTVDNTTWIEGTKNNAAVDADGSQGVSFVNRPRLGNLISVMPEAAAQEPAFLDVTQEVLDAYSVGKITFGLFKAYASNAITIYSRESSAAENRPALMITPYTDEEIETGNEDKDSGQIKLEIDMMNLAGPEDEILSHMTINLPKFAPIYNTPLKWSSNDSDVIISDEGEVSFVKANASKNVQLTVEFGDSGIYKRTYNIKLIPDIVTADAEYISDFDIVVGDEDENVITYTLPNTGIYGSDITWKFAPEYNNSTNDTIVNGVNSMLNINVANTDYSPKTVTIVAEISDGADKVTVSKVINVAPKTTNIGGYIFRARQIGNSDQNRTSFSVENNQLMLTGFGTDVWSPPDAAGYFYTKSTAENISMTIKIDELIGTQTYRRFGIMFRQSEHPEEKMVLLAAEPRQNLGVFALRNTAVNSAARQNENRSDVFNGFAGYLKLVKEKNSFKAYYSADGVNFIQMGKEGNCILSGEYLMGIVVAPASNDTATGYFSQIAINDNDLYVADNTSEVKAVPGDKSIHVTWKDPVPQDGRNVEKMVVSCYDEDNEQVGSDIEIALGTEQADFTDLINGEEYTVKVRAKTGILRTNATGVSSYNALSAPVSASAIPIDLSTVTEPTIQLTATPVITGQKSNLTMAFAETQSIYRMELEVYGSTGMVLGASEVILDPMLVEAGATVQATSNGFRINYNPSGDGKVIRVIDLASFKASAPSTSSKTITVRGTVIYFGDGEEKSMTPSSASKIDLPVTATTGNSGMGSSTGGGGVGGSGFSVGSTAKVEVPVTSTSVATPTPTPAPTQTPAEPSINFTDTDAIPDWAKEAVESLVKSSVISGNVTESGNYFNPNQDVTREQFIKMCVVAFAEVDDSAECEFSDVSEDDWYYPYVATANKLNITNGIGEGVFGVGRLITREEIAVMLYRMSEWEYTAEDYLEFADHEDISPYALDAVYAMRSAQVVNGYEDGRFAPKETATRAMVARMIHNILLGGWK